MERKISLVNLQPRRRHGALLHESNDGYGLFFHGTTGLDSIITLLFPVFHVVFVTAKTTLLAVFMSQN